MTFSAPGPALVRAPGRIWYFVAAAVLVIGAAAAVAWVAMQLPKLNDKLIQVVVPGEATLRLTEAGTYTIFHERTSVVDGRVYASDSLSGLRISLRNERGERVSLSSPQMSSTYNFSGRSGVAVFTFEVAQPGAYRLSAAYDNARSGPRAVLAVGAGFLGALFSIVFGALGFALGGVAAAVIIAAIVFVKRRRASRVATASFGVRPPTVS